MTFVFGILWLSLTAQPMPRQDSACSAFLQSAGEKVSKQPKIRDLSTIDAHLERSRFYRTSGPRTVPLDPRKRSLYETEIEETLMSLPATANHWQVDSLEEGYRLLNQTYRIRKNLKDVQEPDGRVNLQRLLIEGSRNNPRQDIQVPREKVQAVIFAIVVDPQSPPDMPRYQMFLSPGVFHESFNAQVAPRNHATLAEGGEVFYTGELILDSEGRFVHANLHSGHYMSYRARLAHADLTNLNQEVGGILDPVALGRRASELDAQRLERLLHQDFGIPASEQQILPSRVYPTFSGWHEAIRNHPGTLPAILPPVP